MRKLRTKSSFLTLDIIVEKKKNSIILERSTVFYIYGQTRTSTSDNSAKWLINANIDHFNRQMLSSCWSDQKTALRRSMCRYKQRILPFNVRDVLQTNCGHRNVDFQSSVLISPAFSETICRFLLQLFLSFLRRLRSGGRSDMWQEVS